MNCPRCNTPNPEGSVFCNKCGLQLPPPMQNQNYHQPQQNPQMNQYQYGNPNMGYQMNVSNRPTKIPLYKKTWFIVLMCIFLPPIGIALLWIGKKPVNKIVRIVLTVFLCLWTLFLAIPTDGDSEKGESSPKTKTEEDKHKKKDDSKKEKKKKDDLENFFYGEIGLNKDYYMGKEVTFSFECKYSQDEETDEIATDENLCYGSVNVQFDKPQKVYEGEFLTVSGVIGEEYSATVLKNAEIILRGEDAKENYRKELENFNKSFFDLELVSYEELLRRPDTYKNQKVKIELDITNVESDGIVFNGTISGVVPGTENEVVLYDYRENREPRIQEEDRLIVYGIANKTTTVKLKNGSGLFADTVDEYEVPCLYIQYIEFR